MRFREDLSYSFSSITFIIVFFFLNTRGFLPPGLVILPSEPPRNLRHLVLTRLRPLKNAIADRLSIYDMASAADEVEVLEPPSEEMRRGAIFLAAELEKVASLQIDSNWEQETQRLYKNKITHRGLTRFHFEDALVFPYGFSARRGNFFRAEKLPVKELLLDAEITHIDRAHYALPGIAAQYFGHWLMDALPSAFLTATDEKLLLPYKQGWGHAPEYLNLVGIVPENAPFCHVKSLTVYDDIAQTASKAKRYREIRERLSRAAHGNGKSQRKQRVYLRRGNTGEARLIADEDRLLTELEAMGFAIVDVANTSLEDMLHIAIGAEICVTVEGSHMDHAIYFLKENGALITIQPSDRFNCIGSERCFPCRQHFGFTVAEKTERGYMVDYNSLKKVIDLTEKARQVDPL